MPSQLGLLTDNLQEIHAAAFSGKKGLNITPNIWGTRIYVSSAGWGRLWTWLYDSLFGAFFGKNLKRKKLKQAMQHTHRLFQEQSTIISKQSNLFQTYLLKKSKGEKVDEKAFHGIRGSLISWYDATHPFLKLLKTKENAALIELIRLSFSTETTPFACGSTIQEISHYKKILHLEGLLEAPIPYFTLFKASKIKELKNEDVKILENFIKKVNQVEDKLQIRTFHRLLGTLINIFQKNVATQTEEAIPNLAGLELELVDRGCKIFLQKDLKHLDWRYSLRPGDKLICNGSELTLGDPIGQQGEDRSNNLIFSIQNDNGKVVSIGINEAVHALKHKIGIDHGWGIKSVKYQGIDLKGRFAVLERLHDPLEGYQWKSGVDHIHREDENVATPLAKLLQWLLEQERTPLNFSPKYLMFNIKGRLKCLKVALEGEFDFNALEQFAWQCAAGNSKIFEVLMEASGMCEHVFAKFFLKMVINSLEGDDQDAGDIAASMQISDPRIVDRGKILFGEVTQLKERCIKKLKRTYEIPSHLDLPKELGEAILDCYTFTSAAGILPAYLENDVIETVVKTEQLQLKAPDPRLERRRVPHTVRSTIS
jgi:hypothetical protein